jgi:hypothetical protein
MRIGCDAISDIVVERAAEGWDEPVLYQGQLCYPLKWDQKLSKFVPDMEKPPLAIGKFDNRLLESILKNRHPEYRDRTKQRIEQTNALSIADVLRARRKSRAEVPIVLTPPGGEIR